MNLKNLSDDILLSEIKNLVQNERELLTQILHHLREIERRRVFSKLRYTSLFDYAVKNLGYSEDQAARRISAMRLLKDLPEIEEKINSGALSLTHLGMAQTLFRKEKKSGLKEFSKVEKLSLLETLEKTSKREAEKVVISHSTTFEAIVPEKIRPINEDVSEIRFAASNELMKKIERLRGLRAHTCNGSSLVQLISDLCDLGLEKWDPTRIKKSSVKTRQRPKENTSIKTLPAPARVTLRQVVPVNTTKPRYISRYTRREIWQKAKSSCENCSSQFALEVDHIIPLAKGGVSTTENLRLFCRTCNQRAAIEQLGLRKMEEYLK
jgi:5-methylcytosine-specific restriction endonuclease McrA